MRKEIFCLPDDIEYIRISKIKAKKLYNQGKTICIAPVNANMYYVLCNLYTYINKNDLKSKYGYTPHFDTLINEYTFYNCNNELGTYLKYFVNKSDLKEV